MEQSNYCKHHWKLESPNGKEMIQGYCRYCGAVKEFPASETENRDFRKTNPAFSFSYNASYPKADHEVVVPPLEILE